MPDARRWNRIWYGGGTAWLLRPFAWLFGLLIGARYAAYAAGLLRRTKVGCPVVVVGNLTVGGTGKTPLVIWLARRLRARGVRVGIASRGYGSAANLPRLVTDTSSAAEVGDEPLLMHRRAGAPVCVCSRRVLAAQTLLDAGCELILCDDGLQHYALQRDCEIAVIDGLRGLGNGLLLPAGPLRERLRRLERVDFVIVNGASRTALPPTARPVLQMQLGGENLLALRPAGTTRTLAQLRGARVHAVAGIGNPERFFALLRSHGLEVLEHPFPDHYAYAPPDIRFDDALPVIMTEKDAVKCSAFAGPQDYCLPVEARFGAADEQRLLQRIAGLLASGET